ncbi:MULTISPECIES: OmpW family outer membrane protein [unclassified Caballeronia]|uniref:OmpW/AlkL family protein n=1 Tax=unclassified Caballeronia TaxID=2646786 RepID=UPI001BD5512D
MPIRKSAFATGKTRGKSVEKHSLFAAALLSAALSAVCLPAQADQGDILARVRAISIQPSVSAGGTLGSIGTGVNNAIVPELDFVYMVRQSIGVELILATSRHQVTSNTGALGGVNVLPPTLLLQYYFNSAGKVRPYVGAGVNYTLFYNNGLHAGDTPVSIKNSSFGPALQAGVDVQVARNLFVNFDIKKIWMRTSATADGASLGSLKIDPLVVGVGVGMRF